ncbi:MULTISPECIES: fatty acid desaturase [unclassified Pseudomonas]|uniref:fatty acid desaturase n=1 Tax=unclassified Pseudomonas TaxID=196821 RepID=UPI000876DD07|nr:MULTISPECIES: fatty acid desaturase [unclassified Pseudomonas]SCZ26249.1 Fatty acid desaturase [Pseudomonas sp. NFACC44-2]SDA71924.1 Fatty acid desaturase [Pseudomonas sp. NFACC51]SDX05295.1 Fatty acid desaturase [Pseudomonas sp. NFACC08-1]SEI76843.1 Fatty acid desaturase [Pseudomonas sp. NFACC07-1]SFH32552.1 Fatty acid desaturase [Pseudomonas sp. NFACC54]
MPNYLDEAHRAEIVKLGRTLTSRTEWPTWLLLVGFYLAWAFIVFHGQALGQLISIVLLVPLVVLWMSIQHELIHGHPTRWPMMNKALGFLPFAVWYPYDIYRDTHLAHHNDEVLTVPGQDPESRYVTRMSWVQSPRYRKALLWVNKTLGGRLIIGAPLALMTLASTALGGLLHSERSNWRMWLIHLLSVGVLLGLVEQYSAISALQYLLLVALPALSISMVRSFYEHRPSTLPEHRTVINESSGLLSWLFLNLNLHLVHHDLPGLPWFYLPRVYRARREQWIARNNGYVIRGYFQLMQRHLINPVDCPRHPARH